MEPKLLMIGARNYLAHTLEERMNAQTFGQDINENAAAQGIGMAAGNRPPPPPSEHSNALGELEGEIKNLGATVRSFIARLEPVSTPPQPSTSALGQEKVASSPVPVVQKVNRLKSFITGNIAELEDAMKRLGI